MLNSRRWSFTYFDQSSTALSLSLSSVLPTLSTRSFSSSTLASYRASPVHSFFFSFLSLFFSRRSTSETCITNITHAHKLLPKSLHTRKKINYISKIFTLTAINDWNSFCIFIIFPSRKLSWCRSFNSRFSVFFIDLFSDSFGQIYIRRYLFDASPNAYGLVFLGSYRCDLLDTPFKSIFFSSDLWPSSVLMTELL